MGISYYVNRNNRIFGIFQNSFQACFCSFFKSFIDFLNCNRFFQNTGNICQFSTNTFTMGAAQLVVQEAFEMIMSSFESMWSLIPSTTVFTSLPLGGAEMITFFAPAWRCLPAFSLSRNFPVDSMTMSIPD